MIKKMLLAAALTLALAPAARAVDWDLRIVNLDGSTIVDDKGKPVDLSVATVCINALMAPSQEDANLSGEEKIRRTVLAQRIQRREDYKYTAEDVVLLKKLVNRTYPSPLIVSQTWAELERR